MIIMCHEDISELQDEILTLRERVCELEIELSEAKEKFYKSERVLWQ